MILRLLIGAAVGAGFWASAGTNWSAVLTGACPLTSNPVISTLYGMTVGALIAGSLH